MPSLKSLNLSTVIMTFLLLIHYFTLWPWPLTLIVCSVSPVMWWNCTEFQLHWAIHCGVIRIVEALPMTELLEYIRWPSTARLLSAVCW